MIRWDDIKKMILTSRKLGANKILSSEVFNKKKWQIMLLRFLICVFLKIK